MKNGDSKKVKKFINIFAIIVIIISIISLLPINTFFKSDKYYIQIGIILSAIAVITFRPTLVFKWIKTPQYSSDPKRFIDRLEIVRNVLFFIKTNKSIINVFGINGIGVTESLHFIADLINNKVSLKIGFKYQNIFSWLANFRKKAIYLNVSNISSIEDIIRQIFNEVAMSYSGDLHCNSVAQLVSYLDKNFKKHRVIIFDEVEYNSQMLIIDDFCEQYFYYHKYDTFIIGTNHKFFSYNFKYQHLEISKFDETELLILARIYNVSLNKNDSVELYELSNGIPLYAHLLLRYYDHNGFNHDDLIKYILEFVIPNLSNDEKIVLKVLYSATIINPIVNINDFILNISNYEKALHSLEAKGLLNIYPESKVSISKLLLGQKNKDFIDKEICYKLYNYYKSKDMLQISIAYLLLSSFKQEKEIEIDNYISEKLEKKDSLSLSLALTPSLTYKINIKEEHPNIYLKYTLACIFMLNMEGKYLKAKDFIEQLVIDGYLIQRVDKITSIFDFNLYFMWADTEHLLNNYNSAIQIIEMLIDTAFSNNDFSNKLPKLYWMKAHCLRHQWKSPKTSLYFYQLCKKNSISRNDTEYIIRSLHGQILIALINHDVNFDFVNCFEELDIIYSEETSKFEHYKYTTYKYKSIYCRLHGDWESSKKYLKKSLCGFKKIKKRNLYDVFFEFGEHYRQIGNFEKSKDYYRQSLNFACSNSDYNLESLSKLGILICEYLSTGSRHTNDYKCELLTIAKVAKENDLNLNHHYALFIARNIDNIDLIRSLNLFNP